MTFGIGKVEVPSYVHASYMIYKDSLGKVYAVKGDTGSVYHSSASSPATATETRNLFQDVFDALKPTGGLAYVKRGLYQFDGTSCIIGDSVTYPGTRIDFLGEGWNTILQNVKTTTPRGGSGVFEIKCHCVIQDLHFDGNYSDAAGPSATITIHMNWPAYLYINRCRFENATSFHVYNAGASLGEWITNNWFGENTGGDQHTEGCQEFAYIVGNLYNRQYATAHYGTTNGSCQTNGGSAKMILWANNTCLKTSSSTGGSNFISLEAFNHDHSHYLFTGNMLDGPGRIFVGGQIADGQHAAVDTNITISNNVINGGSVWVDSTHEPWPNTDINYIQIVGNRIYKPDYGGIMILGVNGPAQIIGNTIVDSNQSASASTSRGGIYITKANDIEITDNLIVQKDTATNVAPQGLRLHGAITNLRAWNNRFLNTNGKTIFLLETTDGSNSNVQLWDNEGYKTNAEGCATITGNGSTTSFTIAHDLAVTPTWYVVQSDSYCYVSAADATNITVRFPVPPTTGSHTVMWRALKRIFA